MSGRTLKLTFLLAIGQVFEEVDGDALGRRQVSRHIDGHEKVDFVLRLELGGELLGGDAFLDDVLNLHIDCRFE